ncbi:ASCH domain-containing protein [Saccharospirillum alexandrii]|uniref:ASCH domain-containing protein n=1 Tax=Saccharospirillum alexandrii TaxID=2448477 RepID=UPI003734EB7D
MMFRRKLKRHILSGRKTSTVRNKADSDYHNGQELDALLDEDGSKICRIQITSIEPVQYNDLNRQHAKAEYLPFVFILKWIIRRIYPGENELFFIRFKVLND